MKNIPNASCCFILLLGLMSPVYAGGNSDGSKSRNIHPALILPQSQADMLKGLRLRCSFERVTAKRVFLYLAQILRENKVENIKMVLLSEINLSDRNVEDNTFDLKITAKLDDVSFLRGLDMLCAKAKLNYLFDGNKIVIGRDEILAQLSK